MATLGNNVKVTVLKGLEALGKTAAGLSTAAQQKLSEINVEARRNELRKQIPGIALELWKEGVMLPEKLNPIVQELGELEEKLAAMRVRPDSAKEESTAMEGETVGEQEATDPLNEPTPETKPDEDNSRDEPLTEGLEKAAHCAGEVIGSALDAVGSFVENAAGKVSETVESLWKRESGTRAPQDGQSPQAQGGETADEQSTEDEGTGDNA